MKSLTLVLFWIAMASFVFAQKEVIVKESKGTDKTVKVDVQKAGDGERTVSVITDTDGKEKTIEWTDNGEIPEDIKKQLKEEGIDISMLDGSGGKQVMVKVKSDGASKDKEVHKQVIVIKKEGDGEDMTFEWDGEGEMPAEMKEMMEEHDIDIDELHEGHGKGKMRKAKMRVQKDKMKGKRHKEMKKGRKKNTEKRGQYKIVTIDEEGNEKVNTWVSDDDEHEGHDGEDNVFIMKGGKGMHTRGGNEMFFFSDDDDDHLSDAYMGAHIESTDNGAKVLEIIKDGPADKAGLAKGDVISRVNGARARNMDGLLGILNYFDPADKVELTVTRDGKERKINLTLGQRPDSMK